TPLDTGTAELLSHQARTVALIRRAAGMREARWELNGDANKMVEIGNKLPRLSALMVLQARHELRDGQAPRAVDDLMDAMAVSRLTNFYDALAKGGELPPDQFDKVVDEQIAKFSANPFAGILGPQFKRARQTVALLEAKQAMLATAIDVILRGDGAAATSKDPFGKGPFAFTK